MTHTVGTHFLTTREAAHSRSRLVALVSGEEWFSGTPTPRGVSLLIRAPATMNMDFSQVTSVNYSYLFRCPVSKYTHSLSMQILGGHNLLSTEKERRHSPLPEEGIMGYFLKQFCPFHLGKARRHPDERKNCFVFFKSGKSIALLFFDLLFSGENGFQMYWLF